MNLTPPEVKIQREQIRMNDNNSSMNKNTATHYPSDIYEKWVDKFLQENPDCWSGSSRQKKRKREFIYRSQDIKIRKKKLNQGKEVVTEMSFSRWLKIIEVYYLLARKDIINGRKVSLGHRLGRIRARTVSRNFKNKQINWVETKKQPLIPDPNIPGKLKRERIIYHTSETYCRIAWEKLRNIPNESVYKFIPSGEGANKGGFKKEFKTALKENPLLKTQYKQCINELISLD
jgi:hypothetical protein